MTIFMKAVLEFLFRTVGPINLEQNTCEVSVEVIEYN